MFDFYLECASVFPGQSLYHRSGHSCVYLLAVVLGADLWSTMVDNLDRGMGADGYAESGTCGTAVERVLLLIENPEQPRDMARHESACHTSRMRVQGVFQVVLRESGLIRTSIEKLRSIYTCIYILIATEPLLQRHKARILLDARIKRRRSRIGPTSVNIPTSQVIDPEAS
jgi:hypothetical protein